MAASALSTPPDQRLCSEAALDALCNELTAYYFFRQEQVSPGAAVDAIGEEQRVDGFLFFFDLFDLLDLNFFFPPSLPLKFLTQSTPGYRIGRALAERASLRREGLRHPTTLDAVKHACKEIWTLAFGKQVDALRTNHRGTFVLRDAAFRRLASLSADVGVGSASGEGEKTKEKDATTAAAEKREDATSAALAAAVAAATTLRLHSGIVKGALSALGVEADVTAASPVPPAAEFTVILREGSDS